MRGEPNPIGVAKKWEPTNRPNAFFLIQVQRQLERRKTVVVPPTA